MPRFHIIILIILSFFGEVRGQSTGFLPNKGQVYDQNGNANHDVAYLHKKGPLQIQLRKGGFSYEIFKRREENGSSDYDITRLDLAFSYINNKNTIKFNWVAENPTGEFLNFYNQLGRFEDLRRHQKAIGISEDKNIKLVFNITPDGGVKYDIWIKPEVADLVRLNGQDGSELKAGSLTNEMHFRFFNDTITETIPQISIFKNGAETPLSGATWQTAELTNTLKLNLPKNAEWINAEWIIIDPLPILKWASYYGGTGSDFGFGVSSGFDGNGYFCGSASSSGLATSKAYKSSVSGLDDAFYCKVDRKGGTNARLYSTYLGGKDKDIAYDIKTLKTGSVLLTGVTNSQWLSKNSKYDSSYNAKDDAFIALINDTGHLEWFNYIGGPQDDIGNGINIDSSGNFLFIGYTESSSLGKVKTGYFSHDTSYAGNGDVLIGKFTSTGECLFLSYYGGTASDNGYSICAGLKDTIFFAGETKSNSDISIKNSYSAGIDGFICKLNPLGQRLTSRYFGSTEDDVCYSIDFYKPNIFVTGKTNSKSNIATSRAFRKVLNYSGGSSLTEPDAYLVKLNTSLDTVWATYFGGNLRDDSRAMVIDDFGYIYITGSTESPNNVSSTFKNVIATSDAYQKDCGGGFDSYICKFSNSGNRIWATYFGDRANDYGYDLAHGKFGDVYFAGATNSTSNITKNPFQDTMGGTPDAYFADLSYCKKYALLRKDTVCLNDTFSIKFTDSSQKSNWALSFKKYKFEWSGPNNFKFSLQTLKRKALWKDTGIYQLIVTDSFGCKDTAKIRVNYFYPLPIDTLLSAKSYCKWDTLKFKATAGPWKKSNYQFYWRSLDNVFKSGNKSDTIRYPALKGKTDGKYVLRIRDHLGCSSLDTFLINVGPTFQISTNSPICPKDTIELKTSGTRLKKIIWKGPNNFIDSGNFVKILNANVSHIGKYTAYITDSSGCKDTISTNITLYRLDSLLLTRNDPICSGSDLKIIASMRSLSGKTKYSWSGPNSYKNTGATVLIVKATAINAGTYTLSVTDTSSKCTIDTIITVTIRSLPYPNIKTNAPVCEGTTFTIRSYPSGGAGSGYKFSWTTPKGTTSTDTGLSIKPVTRADSGVYKLQLKDVYGCTKDTSVLFSLKMLPDVNFSVNKDSQCYKNNSFVFANTTVLTSGSFKSFTWKIEGFADSTQTTKTSITRKFSAVGRYKVTLIARSNDGCIDSLTKYVGVHPEPSISWSITSKDTQCLRGNKFTFDDKSTISSGTLQRYWTFGDGGKSSANPSTNTYSSAGDFTVKLRIVSGFGCADSSTKKVRVNDNPKATFTVNKNTQCFNGHSFVFNDISTIKTGWKITTRKWNVGFGYSDTSKQKTSTYTSTGTYNIALAVMSTEGCTDTAKTTITINPNPKSGFRNLTKDSQCNKGDLFTFDDTSKISSGTFTRIWLLGDGTTGTTNPYRYSYQGSGTYNVTLKSISDKGCRDSVAKNVIVHPQAIPSYTFSTAKSQCLKGNLFIFKNASSISSGTLTYIWNTGDGRTSSRSDTIQHTYKNYGAYAVKLFTASNYGCKDTFVDSARISAMPVAKFWVASKNQCFKGNRFPFRDTSTIPAGKITSWKWYFGNGDSSSSRYPIYSYKTAGTYAVRLAVASGSSCSNTFTDTIRVYPQATVAFSINNDKQCLKANQKFIFTNASTIASGSISSYNWTTGDGKSSSRSDTIQHTYSKDGTFTVSLFTSSNFGCKDTLNKTAIVYPMPVVSFTINNASQCLKGNAFAFTDKTTINSPGSITSRNWSFGDKKKSTSTLTNPSFTYDTATSFSVKLISTSTSGCKDSATQTVNVRPMPKSIFVSRTRDTQCLSGNKFTFSDTSTISSGSYTRLWMFGDGNTSTAQPASNTYATDGIYTVKLALNSNYNCKDTTSKPIVVYPMPVAQIGYKSSSLCEKQDTGVFSVISNIKYGTVKTKKWYFGDGTTDTGNTVKHIYKTAGTYTLSLVINSGAGCKDSTSITINVRSLPVLALTTNKSKYCVNDKLIIDLTVSKATLPITYTWTGPNSYKGTTQDVIIDSVKLIHKGRYYVQLKDAYGCKGDTSVNIIINPLPTATAFSNSPVCTRGKLSLRSNGGNAYEWFGPKGYTSKQQNNVIFNVDSNYLGNYTVWVTDTNQCKNDFTIKVDIKPGFRVSAKTNSPVCTNDTLKFFGEINSYNKSTYSYEWVAKSFYSTVQNPIIDLVDSSRDGVYRFVAMSANGCTDTAYVTPTILRPPLIKFITNSPECVGQKAILFNALQTASTSTWRKPNGVIIVADTVKITSLKLSDAGYYRLSIKDSRGCRNQDSIKYTVNKLPTISVTGDSQLCTGSTLKLNVKGAISYKWTGPNGFLSFTSSPVKVGVTMPDSGLYTVIGADANLCRDTARWNVKINPAIPGLKIFGDSQVCLWEKLTLNTIANTKNYRYKWRTPNGEFYYNPKLVIPLNKYSYEGVYSVVVSDSNYYCKDSVTDYVWVGPRPMSSASNSPVCAGDSLKFNAYGNSRWKWQWTGPQGFTSTLVNPSQAYVTSLYAGTYTLIGKDTLGCTDTLTENVKINDCLVIELFADSVKCKGNSSGLARVVAKGGSGFYQYKWLTSPARFDDTLKNIPKGTYTVVVTDTKTGFVRIDSIRVGEPAAILSVTITVDTLICRDSSNAKLTSKATGGTAPYSYKWNGNSSLNASVLTKVGAGNHTVSVTDNRGCIETAIVTVVNPQKWNFSIARNDVLCAGGKTGDAMVAVSGGKPSYFYQWDTVTWISKTKSIGNTYKNLKFGIYKVLVTDANGCQQSDTVMINQPDSLKFSMKIDNYIRCFGDTTGQITATAKGGKGTYTYLWNFNKNYNNKTAVNLASGWYVLRLRDNNNCLTIDSIFMPQPDDIKTKIATVTNLKCYNDKTGYAEINVTGGTTPYYVKWDNGGYTSQGFSKNNLTAGNHWAYVRDFQGCYDTLKITLYQPDSILTLYKTRRDVLCYKGNTGWAEMEIVGGTKPYQYLWENGDTTKRASNLLANSYWLRIKDKNGCLYNDTIQMAQPAELDVFVKRTDSVSCYGFSDGIAEITATGGIAPYGYWYFDGKDTIRGTTLKGAKARQLPFKYDGYVMDAHGCVDYTPVYIKEPAKLQVVRNGQVDLLCYGARTASISVGAKGGNGGYMYNWNSMPKQFTPVAKDLKAGSYILTLKDYKGCTTYDTITIKQPAKNPVLALSSIPFCLNKDVQLSAYMYELDSIWWFNPFNKLVSNAYPNYIKIKSNFLDSGYYTILARDKQGCYDTTKIKVVINNLPRVSAWIRETGRYCKSDTITLMSTGALGYNWTGPNNFSSNLQNPTLTGLRLPMNGKYIVTGTDMNSCQSKDSLTLNIQNNININADQEICAGSNLTLTGSGAEKYNWSGPHGFSSTLQSPFIVDVEDSMAGKYTLFAVDKYGCKDTLFTHTLIYPRPFINPTAIQPVCAGEPLNLSSNGGGNYQYRWEGPLNFITSSTNPRIMTTTAKESGYYNVHASYQADVNNLCKDSARVFARIFDNPIASFLLTPQSTIYLTEAEYNINDNSKGANRWSYYLNDKLWSANPYTTFTVNDAGRLFIKQVVNSADFSVYSNQYCTDSIEQVFIIEYKPKIWLPNAFTPNNNNKNELFYPIGVNITEYRLRIFDRWGNKIFDELNGKWDGMDKNGNPYPVGAYGVYLTYKDITGQEREIKDNVTLLR